MTTKEDRDRWTEEALEVLKLRPEANPACPTTETAAWRAGYVAGWVEAREQLRLRFADNRQSVPPKSSER